MARILRYASIPPPLGARVDWGHPLANGLVECQPYDVAPRACLIRSSNGNGPVVLHNKTLYTRIASDLTVYPITATVITQSFYPSAPSKAGSDVVLSYTSSDISPWVSWGIELRANVQFMTNNAGSLRLYTGIPVNAGTIYRLSLIQRQTSWECWSNSAKAFSETISHSYGTNPRLAVAGRNFEYDSVNLYQQMHVCFIHKRELPPTEIAWLHAEPFAMFFLEKPVYYSIPSTVYRAYPRSRIIGTGVYCL